MVDDDFDEVDDYDEFFERFKEYFNVDSDIIDAEFYIFPEKEFRNELMGRNSHKKDKKGFKISFHLEKGQEPEFNIHGDVDEEKVRKYLENLPLRNNPIFRNSIRKIGSPKSQQKNLDVKDLSFVPKRKESTEILNKEPYSEVYNQDDGISIIIEIPGVRKSDIILELSRNNSRIEFVALGKDHKYHKTIDLPCQVSIDYDSMELNNGILTFVCERNY